MDPGAPHNHRWDYMSTEQAPVPPKAAPHFPLALQQGPLLTLGVAVQTLLGECAHPRAARGYPRYTTGLQITGFPVECLTQKSGNENFFKKSLCIDAKQRFSMFSWQERIMVTSQKKKKVSV